MQRMRHCPPRPPHLSMILLGVAALANSQDVICGDEVDWQTLYGAVKSEHSCNGPNAHIECSIPHDRLLGVTTSGAEQNDAAGESTSLACGRLIVDATC